MRRRSTAFAALISIMLLAAMAMPVAAAEPSITTVASGLNNPRGVDIGPNGAIYVAEAGAGGSDCATVEEVGEICYGTTGSVTRVWKGSQSRVLTGLPSLALPAEGGPGTDFVGPADVSVNGNIQVTLGDPDWSYLFPDTDARWLGWLIQANPSGHWKPIANIGAAEASNPDGGPAVDSNPFGVAAVGGGAMVADSGGNTLLWAARNGQVSVQAVFPPTMVTPPPFLNIPGQIPQEAVPTSVTTGPDGAFYVGQLTGFPFTVGSANVYRVVPGQAPTVYASGFTNIMDVEFGPDGSLYVLEMAHESLLAGPIGALWRVPAGGGTPELLLTGPQLFAPGGMDVAADGSIYVSTGTVLPGGGALIRIQL